MKPAAFIHQNGEYYPANKNAVAVCVILSRMTLRRMDIPWVRQHGFTPCLTNGEEIGRMDLKV